MALVLTLDVGSTNLKAGLVDQTGKILHVAKRAFSLDRDSSGKAEHNPSQLITLINDACKEAILGNEGKVKLIALASYQFGLILLDENNKPITGISSFADTRAQGTYQQFLNEFDKDEVYRITGCPPLFQYPLSRLVYLKKNESQIFNQACRFLCSKSFIMQHFTGESVTDLSTANAFQLFDINSKTWSMKLLEQLELKTEQFPMVNQGDTYTAPIRKSLATELGIDLQTPVLLGVYDGAALGVALSGLQHGIAIGNFGTSGMLRVAMDRPIEDSSGLVQSCPVFEGTYFNGSGINNAILGFSWFSELFSDISFYKLLDMALHSKPGANGICSFPYFTGERDFDIGNIASGVFIGLRPHHTKADIARSLLEGVAYSFAFVLHALRSSGVDINELRLGGGGSDHKEWMRILASVLNLPIRLVSTPQAGMLGSALMGFTKLGVFKNLREASKYTEKESIVIEPDEASFYQDRLNSYLEMRANLKSLYLSHMNYVSKSRSI